jgi:uncharacterized protein DUF192 probably involved in sugar metabolism
MALLRILLRETVGRLVGADDHARRLLDVFDGRHSPHVRVLFSPGVTVARLEGNERRPAPAAVIQKQHAPTIQEHGLMPGRKARLTRIANPLGEIDEGHQAGDCTHMVIFYLIHGRAGRSAVFELATAPLTWRAYSPACVTRIGPKRASRARNKASNGKPRRLRARAPGGQTCGHPCFTGETVGLMGRTSLGADSGMVFVFGEEHRGAFWMKDTLIPLSIRAPEVDRLAAGAGERQGLGPAHRAEAGSYCRSQGETENASPGVPPRQRTIVPASWATAERIEAGSGWWVSLNFWPASWRTDGASSGSPLLLQAARSARQGTRRDRSSAAACAVLRSPWAGAW